jgi:hypothetical protein
MRRSLKQGLTNVLHSRQMNTPIADVHDAQMSSNNGDESSVDPPTSAEVLRYRYHYGVNLGAVYVLEKWLFSSAFPPNSPDGHSSELEAVKAWIEKAGVDATKAEFEDRWASCVSDADFHWLLNEAHCWSNSFP